MLIYAILWVLAAVIPNKLVLLHQLQELFDRYVKWGKQNLTSLKIGGDCSPAVLVVFPTQLVPHHLLWWAKGCLGH